MKKTQAKKQQSESRKVDVIPHGSRLAADREIETLLEQARRPLGEAKRLNGQAVALLMNSSGDWTRVPTHHARDGIVVPTLRWIDRHLCVPSPRRWAASEAASTQHRRCTVGAPVDLRTA